MESMIGRQAIVTSEIDNLQGIGQVTVGGQEWSARTEKDGLNLSVKDGYVTANGTTLGGDDGIAVAYALALLDSTDLPHPALEVLITVNRSSWCCRA